MDNQRLERALRSGPPFSTSYVAPPLPFDHATAPRAIGRRALAVVLVALLVLAALAGLALLAGSLVPSRLCPATLNEADAVDTFAPGLSQAQRSWGISGGAPAIARPGVIAAYVADPANAPLSVVTIDPETGSQCRLVRFVANHLIQGPGVTTLDWSPAGDALAIGVDDEDDEGTHGQVLIWTPGRLFRVWSGDGTPGLEWAPDGRSIAVWKAWPLGFGGPPPPPETRVINADGSPDRTFGIRPLADGLDWSPDGARWLVIQGTIIGADWPTSASIVDVTDGRVTPIDLAVGHYGTMGWIDDGRVLLRESGDPGVRPLRYLNVPVAAPADLSILDVPDEAPSYELALSPNGRRVAHATANGLAIVDVAAGSASPPVHLDIAGAAGDVGWPSWSPDGKQVLFFAAGAVWIVDADGTGLRQFSTQEIFPFDDPWQPVPIS